MRTVITMPSFIHLTNSDVEPARYQEPWRGLGLQELEKETLLLSSLHCVLLIISQSNSF